jgi:hypothetical protein
MQYGTVNRKEEYSILGGINNLLEESLKSFELNTLYKIVPKFIVNVKHLLT